MFDYIDPASDPGQEYMYILYGVGKASVYFLLFLLWAKMKVHLFIK